MPHLAVHPFYEVQPLLVGHGHAGGVDDVLQPGHGRAAFLHDVIVAEGDGIQFPLRVVPVGEHLPVVRHVALRDFREHQHRLLDLQAPAHQRVHALEHVVVFPALLIDFRGLLEGGHGVLRRLGSLHHLVDAVHDALRQVARVGHHPLRVHGRYGK